MACDQPILTPYVILVNNDKRYRDGFGASWTSWGATTVCNETGLQLEFSDDMRFFVPHLFQILLRALGKAKRTPQEIEVLLRRRPLSDTAFHLPDFLLPTVKPVLQDLKKLLLTTHVSSGADIIHTVADSTVLRPCPGYHLRNFLGHTPNLSHLRLNLQKYQFVENTAFLQWLSKPKPDSGSPSATLLDPPPVSLACLRSLEFGQFNIAPLTIVDVISKFALTLQDLSFWRLNLMEALTFPPDLINKPNKWAGLFATLAKMQQLQLRRLKAGLLNQDGLHVNFKAVDSNDSPLGKVKEYSGPKMDVFLKELVNETVVQWPDEPDELPDADEEDDEDEEDDGDEEE
jgi:hypothetical protein